MMSHSWWWSMRPHGDGSSHQEAPHTFRASNYQGDESSVGVTSLTPRSAPTQYLLIFARLKIMFEYLPGLGDDVCHEKVSKVTSEAQQLWRVDRDRESDICGLAASACCYSFYRNKCFVSSNTAERESSEWEALSLWDFNVSSLYHFGRCSGDIKLRMEILALSSFIILPLNVRNKIQLLPHTNFD